MAALMLLSRVGYLRAEEDGKHSGYPNVGDGSTADPTAGTPHTLLGSLNPSPLLQAFLAHLSVCLCDKS